jgi:hypothetical protein
VAGVVIDPAPTPGVLVGWQTIKSTFPVFFSWGSWRRVMTMSRSFFATRFAQTVPPAQVDAMYDRYIVPTPGRSTGTVWSQTQASCSAAMAAVPCLVLSCFPTCGRALDRMS